MSICELECGPHLEVQQEWVVQGSWESQVEEMGGDYGGWEQTSSFN